MKIYNGYAPHSNQVLFHRSKAKFRALITGVGYGKSAAGANEILMNALRYPKATGLIMAPTSKIMNYATLNQFWKFCPKELIHQHIKSQNLIILKNGARIIYLTADNERHVDRLRGIEIGYSWLDEARLFPKYVWEVLLTRLRDVNGPLSMWVTTTPFGFDWLYYYFVKKKHPGTKKDLVKPNDYVYFTGSTLDNPYTPEEYKQNLLQSLHGRFRNQEIYGHFTGFEGQVYDNFVHSTHILKEQPKPESIKTMIVCCDWGFTNPMAGYFIGFDGDGREYIMREYYRKRQKVSNLGEWIKETEAELMEEGYPGVEIGYGDPSEPAHLLELQEMGINMVAADNSIMPGINYVYGLFEVAEDGKPRLFIHNSCVELVDEINTYKYASPKDDVEQKEKPIKSNDHGCDAVRYGSWSYSNAVGQFSVLEGDGGLF